MYKRYQSRRYFSAPLRQLGVYHRGSFLIHYSISMIAVVCEATYKGYHCLNFAWLSTHKSCQGEYNGDAYETASNTSSGVGPAYDQHNGDINPRTAVRFASCHESCGPVGGTHVDFVLTYCNISIYKSDV